MLGPGVLTTVGSQHKQQRKLLNPVFSSAHLRNMTHIFYKVAHRVWICPNCRRCTNLTLDPRLYTTLCR